MRKRDSSRSLGTMAKGVRKNVCVICGNCGQRREHEVYYFLEVSN